MPPDSTANPTATREFFAGAGILVHGLRMWITSPRLMLLGALPALIVGSVYVAGIVVLLVNLESIVVTISPFASGWGEPWRTSVRVVAGAAVAAAGLLLLAYTFVAVTLLVGDPFYERIWRAVETNLGDAPVEAQRGLLRGILHSVADALRLVSLAVLVAIVVLLCGLVPGLGQLIALVLGALLGGWILTLELTGFAFDARGFTLTQRRRMLRARRSRSLGFGVLTYVLFLIPGAAVIVMPAAVAGAALLSRDVLAATSAAPPGV
ncbi:MAG: EI24 domain-containing protein [Cryobacterium sp.]|uniref:EI24 domain-containing protein n=1 Tax=unclassified Cryobacterium TaxID=2649013 RepID=UPI0018CB9ED2|nr:MULTISPECIES: EI24 domain-containing protein [unclassified Cryobacterium]MCY7403916.1 EI24 domain-containing protein [Cryobacterium sp.]MEC5153698.1 CysZ protein [Cryobacterium sp. CAN_C3]